QTVAGGKPGEVRGIVEIDVAGQLEREPVTRPAAPLEVIRARHANEQPAAGGKQGAQAVQRGGRIDQMFENVIERDDVERAITTGEFLKRAGVERNAFADEGVIGGRARLEPFA